MPGAGAVHHITTKLMRCSKFVLYEQDRTRIRKTAHQGGRQGHRNRTEYPAVGDAQKELGANGVAIAADVTKPAEVDSLFQQVEVGVSTISLTGWRFSSASAPRRPMTLYCDELVLYKEAFD